MAAHKVKCFYCGQTFDANKEPFVKPKANRYAHKACHDNAEKNKTQEERDREALIEYIKYLFGANPNPRVWKQMKDYHELGYSYSGMQKALYWHFELRHESIEKANGGIGIIPYVYEDAKRYFFSLYLAKISNEEANFTHKVREFNIEPPAVQKRPPRLFNLDEVELNEQE